MSLSSAPGKWRWEDRGERGCWRVHDGLAIEDGPHRLPAFRVVDTPSPDPQRALELHEAFELAREAVELDSGTLAEALAHAAHTVAYQPTVSTRELIELAALALEAARRRGTAEAQPAGGE